VHQNSIWQIRIHFTLNFTLDIIVDYSFLYLFTLIMNFLHPYLLKPLESQTYTKIFPTANNLKYKILECWYKSNDILYVCWSVTAQSTLSLISVLDGGLWSTLRPSRVTPAKETRYHCPGGLMGPRASLYGYGKSGPHRNSIPVTSSP
jgi:hypothetical protein